MSIYRDMCVLLGPSYGEYHDTSSSRLFANAGRVQTSFRESLEIHPSPQLQTTAPSQNYGLSEFVVGTDEV